MRGKVHYVQFLALQKKSLPISVSEKYMLQYRSICLCDWGWRWLRQRTGTHDFPSPSKQLAVWPWVSHWLSLGPSCFIHVATVATEVMHFVNYKAPSRQLVWSRPHIWQQLCPFWWDVPEGQTAGCWGGKVKDHIPSLSSLSRWSGEGTGLCGVWRRW